MADRVQHDMLAGKGVDISLGALSHMYCHRSEVGDRQGVWDQPLCRTNTSITWEVHLLVSCTRDIAIGVVCLRFVLAAVLQQSLDWSTIS